MESSFYCMVLSKIANVVYIVLSINFLIVHMFFILLINCTVVKERLNK